MCPDAVARERQQGMTDGQVLGCNSLPGRRREILQDELADSGTSLAKAVQVSCRQLAAYVHAQDIGQLSRRQDDPHDPVAFGTLE